MNSSYTCNGKKHTWLVVPSYGRMKAHSPKGWKFCRVCGMEYDEYLVKKHGKEAKKHDRR